MTILDLFDHPDLLGGLRRFQGPSWAAWRVALKALFALQPMDREELILYAGATGRDEPPTEEADEAAFIVGRRGGKSQVAALIAVFLALFRDWQPYLGPGERAHVVVIAQSQRAARTLLNYIRGLLRAVPAFAREIEAERAEEIDLRNRVTIAVWPATYRATRGLTIVGAILDEIDYWWQESVNAAEEVVAAIRPSMATLPQAKLIAISSPYTPTGWLHRFFRDHWAQPGRFLVWKAPSLTMNPTLSAAKIAAATAEDPERGLAEWQAEWRSGLASLLDYAGVDAAGRRDPLVLPPRPGLSYVGGIDPSGGGADEFAWAIAHDEDGVAVVDLVAARGRRGRHGLNLEATVRECAEDLMHYGIREAVGDHYGGDWPAERFAKHGIVYRKADRPKSDIYLDLLPLLTAGQIQWPEDLEMLKQAKLLQRKRGSRGKDQVEHPVGVHDDRINAAAIAVTEAAKGTGVDPNAPIIVNYSPSFSAGTRPTTYIEELEAERAQRDPW